MFRGLEVVRPVGDCCDAGVECLERSPQRAGVDVLSCVFRGDAGQHDRFVARSGDLRGVCRDGSLPDVPVRVDKPGDHEPPVTSITSCVVRGCRQVGSNCGDQVIWIRTSPSGRSPIASSTVTT